jgi:hypothetical protein
MRRISLLPGTSAGLTASSAHGDGAGGHRRLIAQQKTSDFSELLSRVSKHWAGRIWDYWATLPAAARASCFNCAVWSREFLLCVARLSDDQDGHLAPHELGRPPVMSASSIIAADFGSIFGAYCVAGSRTLLPRPDDPICCFLKLTKSKPAMEKPSLGMRRALYQALIVGVSA